MAKSALLPTCRISSTGSSEMMPKATARRHENPGKIPQAGPDCEVRRQRARIDDGRHRVRGIVEAVDELESERDQERDEKEQERQIVRDLRMGGTFSERLRPPCFAGGIKGSTSSEVLIFYILWTGCQWKARPKDLPPQGFR
jgi:hypothetical protein